MIKTSLLNPCQPKMNLDEQNNLCQYFIDKAMGMYIHKRLPIVCYSFQSSTINEWYFRRADLDSIPIVELIPKRPWELSEDYLNLISLKYSLVPG